MRSLVLAGGGMKVAFQGGVLQVLLDEAGLEFDHVDGCSGGTFNLAMMCQGLSGTEIADAWRRTNPLRGVSPAIAELWKGPYAGSLFTLDTYRRHVFPGWGLDWERIRSSPLDATFNLYNVTEQRLESLPAAKMDEDALCACVSLPTWFPPVQRGGSTYIDAVYVTDGNVEEAIDRGADEIWVIWTVSERGDWDGGLVGQYFATIEATANGHLRRVMDRIARNNAALERGEHAEYGRRIELQVLRAEVPLHYLVALSADRLHLAVERGVEAARAWCRAEGIALAPAPPSRPSADPIGLRFSETMRGLVVAPEDGSRLPGAELRLDVTVSVDDLDLFLTDPRHQGRLSGTVTSTLLGGTVGVADGSVGLLVDDGDPTRKEMRYELRVRDDGRLLTISGVKTVASGHLSRLWAETTTLDTVVRDAEGGLVAAGTLHLHLPDFLVQLTTFRTVGSSLGHRAGGLARFAAFFAGHLWDVYARPVLAYSPI